jgi:odorant receptor
MDDLVFFSDFSELPQKYFNTIGVIIYDKVDTKKENFFKKYRKFAFSFVSTVLLQAIILIFQDPTNVKKNIAVVPLILILVLVLLMVNSIVTKEKDFKVLIETLNDLFPKTKEEKRIFKVGKYLKSYKTVEKIYSNSFLLFLAVYILTPLVQFFFTGNFIQKYPFELWYPFDEFDPKFYIFMRLAQIYTCFTSTMTFGGFSLSLFSIVTVIKMQLDMVSRRIKEVNDKKTIVELVETHKALIEVTENLKEIYSPALLFNYFSSSSYVCCFGFILTIGVSLDMKLFFLVILSSTFMQILLVCYYGQELIDSSENIAKTVYESDWYENKTISKDLHFIMLRSQRPLVLRAGKFSVIALRNFATVS